MGSRIREGVEKTERSCSNIPGMERRAGRMGNPQRAMGRFAKNGGMVCWNRRAGDGDDGRLGGTCKRGDEAGKGAVHDGLIS